MSDFATKVHRYRCRLLAQDGAEEGLDRDARTSSEVAQAQLRLQVFESRDESTVVALLR
jgi:hypothetical protein